MNMINNKLGLFEMIVLNLGSHLSNLKEFKKQFPDFEKNQDKYFNDKLNELNRKKI